MASEARFGGFALNAARGCLEDATGAERFLRPKAFRVLEALAARPDCLVSKDELVALAWPDVTVSDESLAQCVRDIRKALGEDGARHIRTVPRRGYMLVTGASPRVARAEPGGWRLRALAASLAGALAVAGGVLWWPQGAAEWPAETAAESSVPAFGAGGLSTGRAAADAALARAEALLETRDWMRREDNETARALLEQVVAADPGRAEAWAALGLTYWLEVRHLAWGGGRREMRIAFDMLERSIALGSTAAAQRLLAEMRLLAPFAEMRSPLDALALARAAAQSGRADPDNHVVLAEALALTGQAGAAVAALERARALQPEGPPWHAAVAGLVYLLADRPARAVAELRPLYGTGDFSQRRAWPGWILAASLAHAGRETEAAAVVTAERVRRPQATLATVEVSLDGFADPRGLSHVLDGLRRAGLPG
jgi:DNA-binding winged helix-turn-helix (wHTH) protein